MSLHEYEIAASFQLHLSLATLHIIFILKSSVFLFLKMLKSGAKSRAKGDENKRVPCKFQKEWVETYTWLKEVKDNPQKAKCTLCPSTFLIGSRGISDVTKHMETAKHKGKVADQAGSKSIVLFAKGK